MDINYVFKGKTVFLGIFIILITYLVSGGSTSILPFIFFTGILVGIMKHNSISDAAVAGFVVSTIGSILTTVISIGLMYVSYGATYVDYVVGSSLYSIVFYIIVGIIGAVIGYYAYKEII